MNYNECKFSEHCHAFTAVDSKNTIVKSNEPAPAATDTSSTMKNEINSQDKDSILLGKCQEALIEGCRAMLTVYNNMSEAEQRAWDLGEAFALFMRGRGELDDSL